MTAEKERKRQGHKQGISDKNGGERRERGDGQEESNDVSEGWSRESTEDSTGLETEEETMNAGGGRWGKGDADGDAMGHAR